ncbi:hypothetical protein Zmor_021968 [Zophobas morio]|uniref:Uncharacterized protein n=1 Tax=Zophobas morio TaxID=2755281 RepID=A0AA38MAX4_9CUCU|nr:hypothetical protein Zmor_021968 [Zophobas morio]
MLYHHKLNPEEQKFFVLDISMEKTELTHISNTIAKINFKFNPEEQKNFVTKTHTEMEISTESLPLYQMTKWKSVRKNTMTSNKKIHLK